MVHNQKSLRPRDFVHSKLRLLSLPAFVLEACESLISIAPTRFETEQAPNSQRSEERSDEGAFGCRSAPRVCSSWSGVTGSWLKVARSARPYRPTLRLLDV